MPLPPQPQPIMLGFAVMAWNRMGGKIDWNALETVTEMLGVDDIEMLIEHVQLIQTFQAGQRAGDHGE